METSFERMLDDSELDAVVIATPVNHHFAMARASLLSGKHTLIEKPMARSSAECEELIDLARRQGLVLMVGHTFLYSAAVRRIKEIIDNHDIGEIRYISARRLNLGLFQKDINVAWDLAPHDISIILYIMQEMPHSINCRGAAHITPGIEDVTSMSLHFTKERSAIIHSSWLDPRKIRDMTIVGQRADDRVRRRRLPGEDQGLRRPGGAPAALRHLRRISLRLPLRRHVLPAYQAGRAAEDGVPALCRLHPAPATVPLTSGENGLDVVRILEAASASARQNGNAVDLWRTSGSEPRPSSAPPAGHGHPADRANGNGRSKNGGAGQRRGQPQNRVSAP